MGVVVVQSFHINFSGQGTRSHVAELEAQLDQLPETDRAARATTGAALAIALVELDVPRAHALTTELLSQAEAHPGSLERAVAFVAAGLIFGGPEHAKLRLARAQEALDICAAVGARDVAEPAWFLLLGAAAEVGDFARIDRELSPKLTSLGPFHELLHGRHAAWIRAMRATADGRVDDAEELAGAGYELAAGSGDPDAETVLRGQLAVIRWLQGRVGELVDPLLEARQRFPNEPVWQAALAWVWSTQGTVAPVAEILREFSGISALNRDRNWLAAATIVAEVAADAGTLTLVRELYEALTPYSGRLAMIGHGVTSWGTVARPLALLARRLGDVAAAERYLREAVDTCARLGAQVWLAEAQIELAQLLREQGRVNEARTLALEAATVTHRIGPPDMEVSARRLLQQLTPLVARGDRANADEAYSGERAAAGIGESEPKAPQIWMIGRFLVADVRGKPVTWRSRKAELVLKVLVARKGALTPREQLLDLVWPGHCPSSLANRFAVAVSTVRRALDPDRAFAHDHFLEIDSGLVRVRYDRFESDSEHFLGCAAREIRLSMDRRDSDTDATPAQCAAMRDVLRLAEEPAFAEERDALWAERVRSDIEVTSGELAHRLAHDLQQLDDWGRAAETYRWLIALDIYDERAHVGLFECLRRQGAYGHARQARDHARRVLGEIGVVPAHELH